MTNGQSDFIDACTVSAESVGDLRREDLLERLAEHDFLRIRGLVAPATLLTALERMKARFDPEDDHATTGESSEDVRGNFQKLSIGCARHGGVNRPRFMRVFYNPLWAEDIYGLHDAFRTLIGVRNLLSGRPPTFATDRDEQGMWTAARVHHFPAGGGFMSAHRDTVLPAIQEEEGLGAYYQLLLLITTKGEDYEEGGGFIEHDGKELCYEDYCVRGDIAVYNATTDHGVLDVDVRTPYRQDSLAGRMAGLVTLYRTL